MTLSNPNIFRGCDDECRFDETPINDDLYANIYNPWIKEITRLTPPTQSEPQPELVSEIKASLLECHDSLRFETNADAINDLQARIHFLNDQLAQTEGYDSWINKVVKLPSGEYVSKKAIDLLPEQWPHYLARLQEVYQDRSTVDQYNQIIKAEIDEANGMAIMTRGVGIIEAPPRSGKDVFMATWCFKMKYYFNRKIILDRMPRRPFGKYILFDASVLAREADKLKAMQKGILAEGEKGEKLSIEQQWAKTQAAFLFKDAVFGASEYWVYFKKRKPMATMNDAISGLHKQWGHIDLLILGCTQNINDLDVNQCQNFITHDIKVFPHPEFPADCIVAKIYARKLVGETYVQDVIAKPFRWEIWGKEPKDYLNGECIFHLLNTKNSPTIQVSKHIGDE